MAVTSQLTSGLCSVAKIHGKGGAFELRADEPKALGGSGSAPSPMSFMLFALSSCQEVTCKSIANNMGLTIKRVSATLEGHVDKRGMLGMVPYEQACVVQSSAVFALASTRMIAAA